MSNRIQVGLAGQPNTGKSTIFNLLTGTRQFVANYPGVTVEKKSGYFKHQDRKFELVDLPGTYSMTSFSLEERVARDFLLEEKPETTINVVDAANLKRNLYLTFQLLEMGLPMVLILNMMDVVKKQEAEINLEELSRQLGIPVVAAIGSKGKGKEDILAAVSSDDRPANTFRIDYGPLESYLEKIEQSLEAATDLTTFCSPRWLAVKLLEGDSEALTLLKRFHPLASALEIEIEGFRQNFEETEDETPEGFIAIQRHQRAHAIDKAAVACHRFWGPLLLLGIIYILYELAIVQGYNITNYTWPLLAEFRGFTEQILPASGFVDESHLRGLILWVVDSINSLLNYVPIFFILFTLIAIIEDVGYMPRMAFILDRVFRRFGLHGQSTLPLILSGVIVGGCCVPGVMACKGIADEKARFATILISPLMNCLAKTPFYLLLIDIYYSEHRTIAFLFISTITIFIALPIAKILTLTILKDKESSPFIMEMPRYQLPTLRGVLLRACERVWLYIKKIISIVVAIAVIVYMLLQFPGLSTERKVHFQTATEQALTNFQAQVDKQGFTEQLPKEQFLSLMQYWKEYKKASIKTAGNNEQRRSINQKFKKRNPLYYEFLKPSSNKRAKIINRSVRKLLTTQKRLHREIKQAKISNSFLGQIGRALEPVTKWAGFNWRINVAFLSCLAAKESAVATLGALYSPENADAATNSLGERMAAHEGQMTPLHALAIILFMALYPPCLATMIMVKLQTGSWKWMMASLLIPVIIGITISTLVFSGGMALELSGWQMMAAVYIVAVLTTLFTALIKEQTVPY